jgi:hypothetical protein
MTYYINAKGAKGAKGAYHFASLASLALKKFKGSGKRLSKNGL